MINNCPLSAKEQLRTKLKGACSKSPSPRKCGGVCSYYQRRTLKGVWSDELGDDLETFHNLTLEDDLMRMWAEK